MIRTASTMLLCLSAVAFIAPRPALAQEAPPAHKAAPAVYKIIFEDERFRVIAATWLPGQTDTAHSHYLPSVVYALNDCTLLLRSPDGTKRVVNAKAGGANAVPYTAAHTVTNVTRHICRAVFVEHK